MEQFEPELFQKREDLLHLLTDDVKNGWKEKGSKKGLKLYTKSTNPKLLDCVKIVGTIDAPWEEVNKFYGAAHTYYDAFKKKNLKGEVLTELKNEANPGVEIVRVELLPGVPFVWNRVFYVCRKNEKITIDGKEKYFWYCPSIPQKFENILEKKVPEDQFKTFYTTKVQRKDDPKKFVVGDFFAHGLLIEPDEKDPENKTHLVFLYQIDLNGSLPDLVVKIFMQILPLDLCDIIPRGCKILKGINTDNE